MTMRDRSDRYRVTSIPMPMRPKRLGSYLLDAGLITPDQVTVALNDQQATGMRLGEVLVARGWIKEQTIEWIMKKVILPEKKAFQDWEEKQRQQQPPLTPIPAPAQRVEPVPPAAPANTQKTPTRREVPISKPLPPVNSSDSDVSWVG
ncbi:hypothetical protein [Thermoleptolyngbya sp. M55_K2018_002]|uniref:hypothetical protein n=1 Tax=Thermoleptolyngbya sp. M55_K2018_002 TaxID=2747808 RepID=UPI0025DBCC57|nr:hypothetical protein [Thermoleptolyngbya sp. M55_K2018_002]